MHFKQESTNTVRVFEAFDLEDNTILILIEMNQAVDELFWPKVGNWYSLITYTGCPTTIRSRLNFQTIQLIERDFTYVL